MRKSVLDKKRTHAKAQRQSKSTMLQRGKGVSLQSEHGREDQTMSDMKESRLGGGIKDTGTTLFPPNFERIWSRGVTSYGVCFISHETELRAFRAGLQVSVWPRLTQSP